jgi:hypothetical protein
MPNLTISEEYSIGLAQLATLPEEAIHELTLALTESPSSLSIRNADAVTSLVSAKVPSIPAQNLRHIIATLLSLHLIRASAEMCGDEFVENVVQAMKRSRRPDLSLDDATIDRNFRNRLRTLLGSGVLDRWLRERPADTGRSAHFRDKFLEAKGQRFTAAGKRERVARSLEALRQPSFIRLTLEEWRQIAEDSGLGDQS